MWFFLSLLIFIALIVLGMGSYVLAFVDFPSLLIVTPSFFLAWGATSNGALKLAVTLPFRKAAHGDPDEVRGACRFLRLFGWAALLMGAVGSLIGAVIMLQALSDTSAIGPALAIAILSIFYGLVFKIITYCAEQKLIYNHNLER